MHFLKTQLFQKAQLQKAEPNSPLLSDVLEIMDHLSVNTKISWEEILSSHLLVVTYESCKIWKYSWSTKK